MADSYVPGNNMVKKIANESLTPSSTAAQTINSTVTSLLSTDITTQIAEKVGALYVFLSTCDTGKGIIWEPRVGEFNRKAIKSVLRDNQLSDLRSQFKTSVFNQLGEVNNAEDYFKIVVKAMEEIGFSDKLEKLQTKDFEPDWREVFDTVRSMITVGKISHHSDRLHINQLFHDGEESIPLLVSDNSSLKDIATTDTVVTVDQEDNTLAESQSHLLLEKNDGLLNETELKSLQITNNRFTVVAVNHDKESPIHKITEV